MIDRPSFAGSQCVFFDFLFEHPKNDYCYNQHNDYTFYVLSSCSTSRNMGGSQSVGEKVLLLGLDGSGKTEVLQRLSNGKVATLNNSHGVVVKSVRYKNQVFQFLELGGKMQRGDSWNRHCNGSKIIFYVVDSTDTVRLTKASATLDSILEIEALANKPLAVLANKQDRITALTSSEVSFVLVQPLASPPRMSQLIALSFPFRPKLADNLNLHLIKDRRWEIFPCSAKSGNGLSKSLEWARRRLELDM